MDLFGKKKDESDLQSTSDVKNVATAPSSQPSNPDNSMGQPQQQTNPNMGSEQSSQPFGNNEPQSGIFNQVIESTSLNGFSGVTNSRLSDRLDTYNGEIWWLPLRQNIYESMDIRKFYDFLIHQEHKEYDMPQAIKSALDVLDKVPLLGNATHCSEDFSRFFCSELVAASLEVAGAIPHINASEVTPIDLCQFSIFETDYYQLKGGIKIKIQGFNSLNPVGWGE